MGAFSRFRHRIVLALLLGLLALNLVAWMQAHAMTHYAPSGQAPPKLEAMSLPEKAWTVLTGVSIPRPENAHTPRDIGLAYSVERIEMAGGEWLEAWYVAGTGPRGIVLMFPPYAASKESLLAPAAALHDMGYDVLMVDFRGVGGSSGEDTTLGAREAQDVARAVGYARQTWPGRRIVLYGVSMGSAAIMRAVALEGVRPDAAILESPFDRLLTTVQNRFRVLGLPPTPAAELVVFWGSVQQGFDGFADNPLDYAASITCPTLLMHGTLDSRVTTPESTAIFERLGGLKQYVEFPGASHELLITAAPQLWKERVDAFLR